MTPIIRVLAAAIAAAGTFVFVLFVRLLLSPILPSGQPWWLPLVVALLCAGAVAGYVWRQTASASATSQGLVISVLLGAATIGGVGFAAGFFGPMIFAFGGNQGPLLGIFVTGPLGVLAGAVGGAIYWLLRRGKIRGRRTY